MFVIMFYGLYEEMNYFFYCSLVGYEFGYIYCVEIEVFEEIGVWGRVLGVSFKICYS